MSKVGKGGSASARLLQDPHNDSTWCSILYRFRLYQTVDFNWSDQPDQPNIPSSATSGHRAVFGSGYYRFIEENE